MGCLTITPLSQRGQAVRRGPNGLALAEHGMELSSSGASCPEQNEGICGFAECLPFAHQEAKPDFNLIEPRGVLGDIVKDDWMGIVREKGGAADQAFEHALTTLAARGPSPLARA